MTLQVLAAGLSVCKVSDLSGVDLSGELCFLGKTDRELSLVCPTDRVPDSTLAREDGWRALRVAGALDFSLVGVLAGIAGVLARNGIPIFALSTYDTDYILTKEEQFGRALAALRQAGYDVE